MDKVSTDTIAAISGTGFLSILTCWFGLRWRFTSIRDAIRDLRGNAKSLRTVETCNVINKNMVYWLSNIEKTQQEMRDDIKQLLINRS